MRIVDNTHRWNQDNECKGCGCSLASEDAKKPCPKPWNPPPTVYGEKPSR